MNRREFIKKAGLSVLGASIFPQYILSQNKKRLIEPYPFRKLEDTTYDENVFHTNIHWNTIGEGLDFSRVGVYRNKDLIDVISAVKINPNHNKIQVFNSYTPSSVYARNIESWQKHTGATVMINSAQYMADPHYMPCAPVIHKGKLIGPRHNKSTRGMLVSEPRDENVPLADLLDFDYDSFNLNSTPYTEGVQHWPIILDREGKVKVKKTLWQANRTIVAKDKDKNMLFLTTEGGYFTLFNLGNFLKDSNSREDKGYNIHTAMNMDGGYEANMIVRAPELEYLTYGSFETYGPGKDYTVFNTKIPIPGVIGVFPREKR
jgi:hypothetical protein